MDSRQTVIHERDPARQEESANELLGKLAHEIRNPLAAVVNGVQVLRQSGISGPLAEQTLDLIERQLKCVVALTETMLQPGPQPGAVTSGMEPEAPAFCAPPVPLLKMLVVEDNRDVAKSFTTMLRLWGHEVFVAYDGLQSLTMAEKNQPQFILLDLDLPDLDGYAVARRLRESSKPMQMHLIAVTASGDEKHRHLSGEAGFDAHLVKPVAPEALKRLLALLSANGNP